MHLLARLPLLLAALAGALPVGAKPAAASATSEGDCAYPGPPRDGTEVRRRLEAVAPGVRWSTALRVALTGKGARDHVMLGTTSSEAVVGVVIGAACDLKFVFRFRKGVGQGDLCGPPAAARIADEKLSSPDDPDAPLPAKGGPSSRRRGFRMEAGDCDAFHFYFDGQAVRWWRR